MQSRTRSPYYRYIDGEISNLVVRQDVVDFRVGPHRCTVERTAATDKFREGGRLRALVQAPLEDPHCHVLAFQRGGERGVHYTGPTLPLHPTILGASMLAAGIYSGLSFLLISATCLFAIEVMFSLQRAEALRNFHLR